MTKQTNVYLTTEQRKALKNMSVAKDSNVSDLVRQAVDEFLKRQATEHYAGLFVTSQWYVADIEAQLETHGFAPTPENVDAFLEQSKNGEKFLNLLAQAGNEILGEMMDCMSLELDAPNQQNLEEDSTDGETVES